jgi:predicted nucleic acid-binding protein
VTLVIDANLISAIILPLPYSDTAKMRIGMWKQAGEAILAPILWEYEVISSLRRAMTYGWLDSQEAAKALQQVMILNVQSIPPTETLHWQALEWSIRLGQARAYDSQYVALAEQIGVELWTADERLCNRARQLDVNWVRWIGEVEG